MATRIGTGFVCVLVVLFLSGCCTCEVEGKIDELGSRIGEIERWIIEHHSDRR